MSFTFLLDYIWRLLVVSTAVLSVVYLSGIILHLKFFKIRPVYLRNTWRFFYLQIVAVIAGSSVYLAFDRQASICFESFLKSSSSPILTRALAFAWLIGLISVAAVSAIRFVKARNLSRQWKKLAAEDLKTLQDACASYGLKAPRVVVSSTRQSPFVFGIFKPTLVLPECFLQSVSDETLISVLGHELAHIESGDNAFNMISLFLNKIFFFHPLVYISSSLYLDVQEKSADLRAVNVLQIPKSIFAKSFFEMIEFCKSGSAVSIPTASAFGFESLKSRLTYLSEETEQRQSHGLLYILIALSVSLTWSVVEARSSLGREGTDNSSLNMCVQVQHEQTLEKIFSVKAKDPVRCE